jgi:hypothetical protein
MAPTVVPLRKPIDYSLPLVARFIELGADVADSPADRSKKKIFVASAVGVAVLASGWVCTYAAFGLWRSAAVPLTYQFLVAVLLGWFARSRRLPAARTCLVGMWLVLPFALQWSLGGFAASGVVMVWAVAAPFGSMILHDSRASIPWFAAFVVLTIASAIAEPHLVLHAVTFSDAMRLLFTAMNVAGVAAVTFGLLQYAVRQRDAIQAALEVEHRLLQAEREKSERLLRQEVFHQVAERSRELGRLLAQGDGEAALMGLAAGARFDARYAIVRPLGAGGMGAVYEVVRTTDGEAFALKVITGRVSRADAIRFAREAEIGARIRHPNLVSIVDVGIAESGAPFLVMELSSGGSLEECRGRFGDVPWALLLLRQIATGLAALHDAGIIHRDLKPANVLLSAGVASPHARISDFGISRFDGAADARARTAAAATATGSILGTPLYMAPELGRGGPDVGSAADIYAFGIVAYEMLTGRPPFAVPPVLLAMTGQPVPPPPAIDHAAGELVLACLRDAPRERPTIQEVIARLETPAATLRR